MAAAGIPDQLHSDLQLAVTEACSNAIEHGYRFRPGYIAVEVRCAYSTIEVTVEDTGRWRAWARDDARGRGTMLMRALMDDVQVESDASGTRVDMRRSWAPAVPRADAEAIRVVRQASDGAVVAPEAPGRAPGPTEDPGTPRDGA
jgi:anti-sigma regulatory factor (Ser/Thr protein kinase)